MENQILFWEIVSWAIWPIIGVVGVITGLVIGTLIKNLDNFRSYAQGTICGYVLAIAAIGIFYFIQSIFFPYYMGKNMHWETVFLNFFFQIFIYTATNLTTTWLLVRKKI